MPAGGRLTLQGAESHCWTQNAGIGCQPALNADASLSMSRCKLQHDALAWRPAAVHTGPPTLSVVLQFGAFGLLPARCFRLLPCCCAVCCLPLIGRSILLPLDDRCCWRPLSRRRNLHWHEAKGHICQPRLASCGLLRRAQHHQGCWHLVDGAWASRDASQLDPTLIHPARQLHILQGRPPQQSLHSLAASRFDPGQHHT